MFITCFRYISIDYYLINFIEEWWERIKKKYKRKEIKKGKKIKNKNKNEVKYSIFSMNKFKLEK